LPKFLIAETLFRISKEHEKRKDDDPLLEIFASQVAFFKSLPDPVRKKLLGSFSVETISADSPDSNSLIYRQNSSFSKIPPRFFLILHGRVTLHQKICKPVPPHRDAKTSSGRPRTRDALRRALRSTAASISFVSILSAPSALGHDEALAAMRAPPPQPPTPSAAADPPAAAAAAPWRKRSLRCEDLPAYALLKLGDRVAALAAGDTFGEEALLAPPAAAAPGAPAGERLCSAVARGAVVLLAVDDPAALAGLRAFLAGEPSPTLLLRPAWVRAALRLPPARRGPNDRLRAAHALDALRLMDRSRAGPGLVDRLLDGLEYQRFEPGEVMLLRASAST
jgi:hypothetical protein